MLRLVLPERVFCRAWVGSPRSKMPRRTYPHGGLMRGSSVTICCFPVTLNHQEVQCQKKKINNLWPLECRRVLFGVNICLLKHLPPTWLYLFKVRFLVVLPALNGDGMGFFTSSRPSRIRIYSGSPGSTWSCLIWVRNHRSAVPLSSVILVDCTPTSP